MRFTVRNVAWLFPFLLTACFHRNHTAQVQPVAPAIVAAPPAKPEPVTIQPAPAIAPAPVQPEAPAAQAATPPVQEAPKPPVHHKKPVPKSPQVASNGGGASNGVSAIGQLSSGDPSDFRRETSDSIAASERGLNSITRKLSDPEQKTAAHIREFLKQARAALASGDVDGAHTLAVKARILLGELSR